MKFRWVQVSVEIVGLALAPVTFNSCVSTAPTSMSVAATDQVILRAEQTAQTARLTFHTFVTLERNNEAVLKQFNPQIHLYANTIRRNGLNWVDSLRAATMTFKDKRTPENQANLSTWISTLTNAVAETNKYIAASRKVSQP
jgi:hypothetical protein